MVRHFSGAATGALQERLAGLLFRIGQTRKVEAPKIDLGIQERDAVNVHIAVGPDLAHDASFDFFVGFLAANDEFLLGREFVLRHDSGAVAAEHDGFGALGEDAPFDVAANEGDSDLFRNACAATFEALRHRSCRRWKGAKLEPSRKPNLRR